MNFKSIKRIWPNAHREWEIILRKKGGEETIVKKGMDEKSKPNNFPDINPTIQETTETCVVH